MLTLSAQTLTTWTRALFGNTKPMRATVNHSALLRNPYRRLLIEYERLLSDSDKDDCAATMFFLSLYCKQIGLLGDMELLSWLAELSRYADIEQAYQIALERYAQKGEA